MTRFLKTWCQSPHPTVHNLKYFFQNIFSIIKNMYLRSGDFIFHQQKSVPDSRFFGNKNALLTLFSKTWCQSPRPSAHNLKYF